jgi:hypothetical protein
MDCGTLEIRISSELLIQMSTGKTVLMREKAPVEEHFFWVTH